MSPIKDLGYRNLLFSYYFLNVLGVYNALICLMIDLLGPGFSFTVP